MTALPVAPTRPVLRYHGGKWRLAPWILSFFPLHRIYVEPFGGAASVLLRKPRSFAEVYNDLDAEVVHVFRVLRDPAMAAVLREQLELTPWSRREFYDAYQPTEDPVERARRTIIRSFMSHGTTSRRRNRTGFRAKAYRQNQTGSQDWVNYPPMVEFFVERLRGVTMISVRSGIRGTVLGRREYAVIVTTRCPRGHRPAMGLVMEANPTAGSSAWTRSKPLTATSAPDVDGPIGPPAR